MNRKTRAVLLSLSLLPGCGGDTTTTPATPAQPAANPAAAPAEATPPANPDMDAAITELMAKPEVPDSSIEIQHVLIGFKGAPRMTTVTRSTAEAYELAKKVYAEAVGGADFDALVKQYTDDSAPGIYPMTKSNRARMVQGFGDVGFRLKVGEIGVAPWNAKTSPFGWHIIKRLK